MFYRNGYLIQGINDVNFNIDRFNYNGINAFHSYPLMYINDPLCRSITNEQFSKRHFMNSNQILEFISDEELLTRYVTLCYEKGIPVRILFIESDYKDEMWYGKLPIMSFLGYECSPIPFDDQIITDIVCYPQLQIKLPLLNENGLFSTVKDVSNFIQEYKKIQHQEQIGDDVDNLYICKVYEVQTDKQGMILYPKTQGTVSVKTER